MCEGLLVSTTCNSIVMESVVVEQNCLVSVHKSEENPSTLELSLKLSELTT